MTLSLFVEKRVIGNHDEIIKKRFDQEGIKLPFPYHTLVYKKDLPPHRQKNPAPSSLPEFDPDILMYQ